MTTAVVRACGKEIICVFENSRWCSLILRQLVCVLARVLRHARSSAQRGRGRGSKQARVECGVVCPRSKGGALCVVSCSLLEQLSYLVGQGTDGR